MPWWLRCCSYSQADPKPFRQVMAFWASETQYIIISSNKFKYVIPINIFINTNHWNTTLPHAARRESCSPIQTTVMLVIKTPLSVRLGCLWHNIMTLWTKHFQKKKIITSFFFFKFIVCTAVVTILANFGLWILPWYILS